MSRFPFEDGADGLDSLFNTSEYQYAAQKMILKLSYLMRHKGNVTLLEKMGGEHWAGLNGIRVSLLPCYQLTILARSASGEVS